MARKKRRSAPARKPATRRAAPRRATSAVRRTVRRVGARAKKSGMVDTGIEILAGIAGLMAGGMAQKALPLSNEKLELGLLAAVGAVGAMKGKGLVKAASMGLAIGSAGALARRIVPALPALAGESPQYLPAQSAAYSGLLGAEVKLGEDLLGEDLLGEDLLGDIDGEDLLGDDLEGDYLDGEEIDLSGDDFGSNVLHI